MDIGMMIKRLRRQRDMTQEDLAQLINCSPKTVSKWERGDGYPDIGFIPVIANVFGVSTDELFGMDEVSKKAKTDAYMNRIIEIGASGTDWFGIERSKIALEAIKEFAGDTENEMRFAGMLSGEHTEKAIAIYERVLDRSTDEGLRNTARGNLAYAYYNAGKSDEAVRIVNAMPSAAYSQTYMLAFVTQNRGKEGLANMQRAVFALYRLIDSVISMMLSIADENGPLYSYEQQARLCAADLELCVALENGESLGGHNIVRKCVSVARKYALAGLYDDALSYLERAADYAERYAAMPDDYEYSGVFLTALPEYYAPEKRKHLRERIPLTEAALAGLRTRTITAEDIAESAKMTGKSIAEVEDSIDYDNPLFKDAFAAIRENPRFAAVIERLETL